MKLNKKQIDSLNGYQKLGYYHPYTFIGQLKPLPSGTISHDGRDVSDMLERTRENCPNDGGTLIANSKGWVCPCGQYKQPYRESDITQIEAYDNRYENPFYKFTKGL